MSEPSLEGPSLDGPAFDDPATDPLPGRMPLESEPVATRDELFEGDEGTLPLAARQVLVAVLKNYTITRGSHWWDALVDHRVEVKARLNDMLLDLHVDERLGVAYKVQVRDGQGQFNALLRESRFTREQTILLVFFRRRHDAAVAAGAPRTFVDRSECLEHVAQYRPATATDVKGDQDRVAKAIDSLLRMRIIRTVADDPDRLEVLPVVAALLPVARLKELLAWLRGATDPDDPTDVLPPAAVDMGEAVDAALSDDEPLEAPESLEEDEDD